MLPQQIPGRKRDDVKFLDKSCRQRALAGTGLSEHEHAEDLAVGRAIVLLHGGAPVVQGERDGLLGRRRPAERACAGGAPRRQEVPRGE